MTQAIFHGTSIVRNGTIQHDQNLERVTGDAGRYAAHSS